MLTYKNGMREREGHSKEQEEELSLRDFFPEVWLFDDFAIGCVTNGRSLSPQSKFISFAYLRHNGSFDMVTRSPHSVTNWMIEAKFWSSGRADVCQTDKGHLITHKNGKFSFKAIYLFVSFTAVVFLDVDVPMHLYENETVQVQVTASADNLAGKKNVNF